jgi:hypothetical protein
MRTFLAPPVMPEADGHQTNPLVLDPSSSIFGVGACLPAAVVRHAAAGAGSRSSGHSIMSIGPVNMI